MLIEFFVHATSMKLIAPPEHVLCATEDYCPRSRMVAMTEDQV